MIAPLFDDQTKSPNFWGNNWKWIDYTMSPLYEFYI